MKNFLRKVSLLLWPLLSFVFPVQAALKVGDIAPEFSAPLSDGTTFKLKDWLNKAPLVLYFYPKDNTPGCTMQACDMRDEFGVFRTLKATVIGISADSVKSHKSFIEKYKLPFPLIADEKMAVAKQFGVAGVFFANRATFILDRHGKIIYANPDVSAKTHSQEIKEFLLKLK